jgi:heat shock protein HtpX
MPAALRWWWGRALAALADDPTFPERLVAHRFRTSRSFGVAFALLLVLATHTLLWSLPLLVFSCTVASFRFRRVIYRESWSLAGYLSFVIRASVAIFGFWLLLAGLPALAGLAGSYGWFVALALCLLLVIWNARYSDAVRLLLRATPIDNPDLVARFTALAQASTAGMPRFEQARLGGGAIANAIALPAVSRPSVLFTDTLLSRLKDDEIVAICGHELAHLEHYNAHHMRRLDAANLLLIAGSLAAVAVAYATSPSSLSPSIFWPCIVVAAMAWRVRDRQQHETESDLRAVALTGDPDALARALTKIHAYAHLPRRVGATHEQQASHPSLARRVKAIQSATPGERPTVTANATFLAADGSIEVTFADARLEWREGDAALHSLSYSHLTELRLHARPSGPPRLLVVERSGRRWDMPLADGDAGRAQAVLDLVDGQLAESAASASLWPTAQRAFTLLAVSIAVLSGQIATMIVALMALARPAAPLIAAAGAALVAAAGLAPREPDWAGLDLQPWLSIGLGCIGAFLLWTAWKTRRSQQQTTTTRLVAALGTLGGLVLLATFMDGADAIRLHQSARSLSAVVVWPLAFAAALASYPGRLARVGAVAAALAGLVMATVGTISFLDRFGRDPLLLPSETIKQVRISADPAAEFTIPFFATDVRLSPGATHLAAHDIRQNRRRDDGESRTFQIGRLGEALLPVVADDVAFLSDDRVLTVEENNEGTRIEARSLGQPGIVSWRQQVLGIFEARLSVEREAGKWCLLGWDSDGRILRARGTIGGDVVEATRWASPVDRPIWPTVVVASGDDALLVETRYDEGLDFTTFFRAFSLLHPGAAVAHLWHLGQGSHKDLGISRIATDCYPSVIGGERIVCSAYDGTRTRIVSVDPATGDISAIGTLSGLFAGDEHPPTGWWTGWRDSTPVALRLDTRELLTLPERQHALVGLTMSDRWLGAITAETGRSTIRLFPLSMSPAPVSMSTTR